MNDSTDIENSLFCGERIGDMDKAGLLEVIRWMDKDAAREKKLAEAEKRIFAEIEASRPTFQWPLKYVSIILLIMSLLLLMSLLD